MIFYPLRKKGGRNLKGTSCIYKMVFYRVTMIYCPKTCGRSDNPEKLTYFIFKFFVVVTRYRLILNILKIWKKKKLAKIWRAKKNYITYFKQKYLQITSFFKRVTFSRNLTSSLDSLSTDIFLRLSMNNIVTLVYRQKIEFEPHVNCRTQIWSLITQP